MAKILLFTKIYDTEVLTMREIEESVQNDLDTYLGKPGMVKVKIDSGNKKNIKIWLLPQKSVSLPNNCKPEILCLTYDTI